ncbi:hypothetical protein CW362_22000 [Streptomyces populi]|uniref:Uncharacterized protein n=1 Tax=Streptomyces populi TaxID=2058924 RepID=A0A2I0SLX4_9ACTN|nr:hypothetical protein CW362_22000 [Streptomyces populi]
MATASAGGLPCPHGPPTPCSDEPGPRGAAHRGPADDRCPGIGRRPGGPDSGRAGRPLST